MNVLIVSAAILLVAGIVLLVGAVRPTKRPHGPRDPAVNGRRVPRSVALIGVASVTAGGALAFGPGDLALAHTPSVTPTCYKLKLAFSNYEGNATNNLLTVVIDGVTHTYSFAGSLSDEISWDSTINHTFSWTIDANLQGGDPTQWDTGGSGSMTACNPPTTTTTTVVPTTTTTAAPTTTTTTVIERKVWICHVPEGNPNNPEIIEVDENGWNGHDGHPDDKGPFATQQEATDACAPSETTTTTTEVMTTTSEVGTTTTEVAPTTTGVAPTSEVATTTTAIGPTTVPAAPTFQFNVLAPICDLNAPYLSYEIAVTGTPNTTATITFVNPFGDDVVYSNLPLSGRLLWPGAAIDANGKPIDWPGWTQLPDGSWVAGDAYDWARSPLEVVGEVNPTGSGIVSYPPSTPGCATNPTGVGAVTETTSPGTETTVPGAAVLPETA